MRPSDIEYARVIFAELVTAIALKRPKSLRTSEIEVLAEQSLNMANVFAAAQQQSIQTHRVALAQAESLDKPLPFGSSATFAQVAQEWMERAVKRSTRSRDDLRSRFERLVLPHLGATRGTECEAAAGAVWCRKAKLKFKGGSRRQLTGKNLSVESFEPYLLYSKLPRYLQSLSHSGFKLLNGIILMLEPVDMTLAIR